MAAREARTWDGPGRRGATAASVRGVVLRIQRTLWIARMGEAALMLLGAGALTMALQVRAGADPAASASWFLPLLTGGLAAACWMREHHQDADQIARSLDARMRHQGSLVTAYELEGSVETSALGRLLMRRVLGRLRPGEALRAMFPSLVLPIAAPLLGLGLLGLSLESAREEAAETADLSGLTEGMALALTGLDQATLEAGTEDQINDQTLREMLAFSDRVKSLRRRSEVLQAEPGRTLEELAELSLELSDLLAVVQEQPELREPLEQAANWMDAARMELTASLEPGGEVLPSKPASGAPGAVTAGPEKGMMSAASTEGFAPGAGGAVEQGTQPEPGAPTPVSIPTSTGALAGEFWPPEYEGVISGWIELQRREKQTKQR